MGGEEGGNTNGGNDGQGNKKKQPPFWEREIKIVNPTQVDPKTLLTSMHERYLANFFKWKRQSKIFKFTNLLVTLTIVAVQVLQVVIFQIPGIDSNTKNGIATILPAVTGAVLAIQLKLGWAEKSVKCKKAARLYNKLSNHTKYRLNIMEAGGEITDTVKVWNTALIAEATEIPPFLVAY